MATVLEIRVGLPKTVEECEQIYEGWPEKKFNSSYYKTAVSGSVKVTKLCIENDMCAHPKHLEFVEERVIMVYPEGCYRKLRELFPESADLLRKGSLGENFVVDHTSLMPEEVCIGDVYRIGSVLAEVSHPRAPCPKVNAVNKSTGLMKRTKELGYAGYFMRILEEGSCSAGDPIVLSERKYPGVSIAYVSSQLWGDENTSFNEFVERIRSPGGIDAVGRSDVYSRLLSRRQVLTRLSEMKELTVPHYRGLATTNLKRLDELEATLGLTTALEKNRPPTAQSTAEDSTLWFVTVGAVVAVFAITGYWYFRRPRK